MSSNDRDAELRAAMFAYLDALRDASEIEMLRADDLRSFVFEGRSIPLIQQRGIVKITGLDAAISIRTAFSRPYDDHDGPDGYPRYKWQGKKADDYDNKALREAMEWRVPLVWFRGVERGWYLADYPVWAIAEEQGLRQFVIAVNETMQDNWLGGSATFDHPADSVLRREYATSVVKTRLHQRMFRERVLSAYLRRCALCSLRHVELLDAAHIKEDRDGGEPIVTNGVAMCVLHHKAFDRNVIGIRPDFVVETRRDVLEETDGPTLRHALQGVHGIEMSLPRKRSARPDPDALNERYELFRAAE